MVEYLRCRCRFVNAHLHLLSGRMQCFHAVTLPCTSVACAETYLQDEAGGLDIEWGSGCDVA